MMRLVPRYLVLGNSGSGKSTLALRLARAQTLPHLDLDTLAWLPTEPPARRPLDESRQEVESFLAAGNRWIIEGCYADLLAIPLPRCTRLIFLNPGVDACVANALARPWEPHKYPSKESQDANLGMLLGWIREYDTRTDVFGLRAHRALFDGFDGEKYELTSRETIARYG
jgi:adenylate kinase family enzyme